MCIQALIEVQSVQFDEIRLRFLSGVEVKQRHVHVLSECIIS